MTKHDANGVPFIQGETVYSTKYGNELTVVHGDDCRNGVTVGFGTLGHEFSVIPSLLTHSKRNLSKQDFIENVIGYLVDVREALGEYDQVIVDLIEEEAKEMGITLDYNHPLYSYEDEASGDDWDHQFSDEGPYAWKEANGLEATVMLEPNEFGHFTWSVFDVSADAEIKAGFATSPEKAKARAEVALEVKAD